MLSCIDIGCGSKQTGKTSEPFLAASATRMTIKRRQWGGICPAKALVHETQEYFWRVPVLTASH